jgi:hypothetical protein
MVAETPEPQTECELLPQIEEPNGRRLAHAAYR